MNAYPNTLELKSIGNNHAENSHPSIKEDDLKIWSAFKEGDEAAFIYIYKEYANLLFNFGSKFSSDKELVKDCLQDFFVYLRNAREKLGDTDSIKHYLLKSFRRRVIEYVNKFYRDNKKTNAAIDFQLQIEISDELKLINSQVQKEYSQKLNRALEKLDVNEKEAVYYFYYEALTYKEIAEILGYKHVSSVRRLIYKSIGKLKHAF